jgi:hypothetical protein
MLASLKNLQTYQKMGLKRFTRIVEWEVEICQGILGMGNLGFPGKS